MANNWQIVLKLSEAMHEQLDANSHKGTSWESDTPEALLARLKEEVVELEWALKENKDFLEVRREIADVANFAAMILDRVRFQESMRAKAELEQAFLMGRFE